MSFGIPFELRSKWPGIALDAGLLCPTVCLMLMITLGFWVVELLPLSMAVGADVGVCSMVALM